MNSNHSNHDLPLHTFLTNPHPHLRPPGRDTGSTGSSSNHPPERGEPPALPTASTSKAGSSARKQNVACDACRQKKIRCQRTSTAETCEQCLAKGSACTSNYIEQLQNKAKQRRKTDDATTGSAEGRKRSRKASGDLTDVERGDHRPSQAASSTIPPLSRHSMSYGESSRPNEQKYSQSLRPISDLRPSEKQANLVRYLLSPIPVTHNHFGYTDLSSMEQCDAGAGDLWEEQRGKVWSEEATEAHSELTDVGMRELADDLVESFFSLAHPRFAMFDPIHIRARLAQPDAHSDGAVPHNLLAIAIAFGARFSDHPAIDADREECLHRDETISGPGHKPPRSRMIQMLIIRAREVIEVQKTFRIPTLNNVQVLIIAEALIGRVPHGQHYFPYYFASAVRHVCVLGYNRPSGLLAIKSEKEKSAAVFAWWLVCISDGFRSVFHRLQSNLAEGEFDVPSADMDFNPDGSPNQPRENTGDQAVVWFGAAAAGSRMCRKLCLDFWNTRVPYTGIPLAALRDFVKTSSAWRDKYLTRLGVPETWPSSWDFEAAITACSTDAYYHALWLTVEHAIKDFGIAELRGRERGESVSYEPDLELIRKRIGEEAEHGALRICALTSVLALNHYLRLDPLILHHPMHEAGLYLAEQGRDECFACVAGIRQYCIAYPQFWSQAEEIERTYNTHQSRTPGGSASSGLGISRPGTTLSSSSASGRMILTPGPSSPYQPGRTASRAQELASNGYTALTDVRADGKPESEKDISFALFEWLHQP